MDQTKKDSDLLKIKEKNAIRLTTKKQFTQINKWETEQIRKKIEQKSIWEAKIKQCKKSKKKNIK